MPTLDIFGGKLHYETHGSRGNPTLLLLHALGSSLEMWDPQIEPCIEHFHIVRYSMRGHGHSTIDGFYELDLDALARDAISVLDAVNVERAHWCGLSIGSMTTLWAASHAQASSRIDRVVLASTAAQLAPPERWSTLIDTALSQGLSGMAGSTMQRWFTPAFHAMAPHEISRIRTIFMGTDPNAYAAACAALRDMNLNDHLGNVAAPALIIAGSQDAGTTMAHAAQVEAGIRGAKLLALPGAHLTNVECSDAFTQGVLDHLVE